MNEAEENLLWLSAGEGLLLGESDTSLFYHSHSSKVEIMMTCCSFLTVSAANIKQCSFGMLCVSAGNQAGNLPRLWNKTYDAKIHYKMIFTKCKESLRDKCSLYVNEDNSWLDSAVWNDVGSVTWFHSL